MGDGSFNVETSKSTRMSRSRCSKITRGKSKHRKEETERLLKARFRASAIWRAMCLKRWGRIHGESDAVCIVAPTDIGFIDPCKGRIECHHLVTRSKAATRYDVDCGVPCCEHHHRHSLICSPHCVPGVWMEFLEKEYPVQAAYVRKHGKKYERFRETPRESVLRLEKQWLEMVGTPFPVTGEGEVT